MNALYFLGGIATILFVLHVIFTFRRWKWFHRDNIDCRFHWDDVTDLEKTPLCADCGAPMRDEDGNII